MKFIDDAIKESEESVENNNTLPETAEDDLDNELIEIIKQSRAKITVVGTGGAGNNTISRLNEIGIEGARTITVNTDAQDLFYSRADKKLLLGRQICGGLGAGGERLQIRLRKRQGRADTQTRDALHHHDGVQYL